MSFFVNVNYRFKIDPSITPDGAIIPASAVAKHELERRKLPATSPTPATTKKGTKSPYPHLQKRLLDPQLYLAGLDAAKSTKHCAVLASYPWFGASGIDEYDSGQFKQNAWRASAKAKILNSWPGEAPSGSATIQAATKACVEFQAKTGMWGIILPAPLTLDPTSNYALELEWLDAGLKSASELGYEHLPKFATVALSDLVLYPYPDPRTNSFLDLVLDTVSARDVEGVYIVIEQRLERNESRLCQSDRTLRSLLYLVHRFSSESKREVGVNFIGAYGLACRAAGASWWASHWYKSLHRIRLEDVLAAGRSYPLYWCGPAALDINLDDDFDTLARADLGRIEDLTSFSRGVVNAARQGRPSRMVAEWAYSQSNCTAAIGHYLESAIAMETRFAQCADQSARADHVEKWLSEAAATAGWATGLLGTNAKTILSHPAPWLRAFKSYRKDHGV